MVDHTQSIDRTAPSWRTDDNPSLLSTIGQQVMVYGTLIFFAVLVGAPFLYMITGSMRPQSELFEYPVSFLPDEFTANHYERLLSGEVLPFPRQVLNSVIVAVGQTITSLMVAAMVGWGFAKYEFPGKTVLFLLLLATLAIPFQVTLVPLFKLIIEIGWLDNYLGIIVPSSMTAFGAFFMRQSMLSIPGELLDAGRIDGATEWGLFWRVGLPLSRGAFTVLGVLVFLQAWNDYLWPLIVLRSPENFTFPLGLPTLIQPQSADYGAILAGSFIVTLPVILIFVAGRKQLLDNLTIGAVKQ